MLSGDTSKGDGLIFDFTIFTYIHYFQAPCHRDLIRYHVAVCSENPLVHSYYSQVAWISQGVGNSGPKLM